MKPHLPLKRIVVATLGAALLSAGASALADPPSRIARLAFISGSVSLAPAGDTNWEYAALNRPLIPGDRVWVEPGARDELQVGGAALRMDGSTLVTLLNLDDRITQMQLSQGRLNVRVRRLRPNEVLEIDTPNLALTIREPGDYRIEVDPAGNGTMVAVPHGLAEAYGEGNAYRLASGQAYSFGGTDLRDVRYARPNLNDDFDRWSASRDQRIEQARSVRYVSPDMIGYEDLDDQGTWQVVPNYGNVWMPAHVANDWAPYRDGHWSYVQPWGWTWVDDAPWGFAVSHYGRWARFNDSWGWVPGPRAASPVYAPALVAFISIGAGAYAQQERPVAWFPLAPREVYRPSYRASATYITNINITNTTIDRRQITRDDSHFNYANRQVRGAVTAVPSTAFVRSQSVSRAAVAVPMAALAGAAIAHAAPVAPERDGMRGRGNPGHQPPPALMQRQVLARTAPPAQLRQAPRPAVGNAAPVQQLAGPAPRILPQDRHGGRQLRDVPMPQPAAAGPNVAPDVRAAQAMQAARNGVPPAPPQQQGGARVGGPGDQRMNHGPGQAGVPAVANVPAAGLPQAAIRDQQNAADVHRGKTRPDQAAPGQQRIDQQAAAAQQQAAQQQRNQQQAEAQQRVRQQQGAAEQQRNQQQAEAQQRQKQQAAEQQRNQQAEAQQRQRQQQAGEQQRHQQQAAEQQRRMQQQAAEQQHAAAAQQQQQAAAQAQQRHAQQQQAAEQQKAQQQAAAQQHAQQQAAEQQQRAERSQRSAPQPAPPAAQPPKAAQPAPAAQQGEGKKDDKRHREHPEQN